MSKTTDYKICTRCIMDTSDPNIRFDEHGVASTAQISTVLLNPIGIPVRVANRN